MLKRYEQIIDSYKKWYPTLYDRTVECLPSGRHSILVMLNDDTKMEFDAFDNTIRNVTRLYKHEHIEAMNELAWREEFGRKLRRAIADRGINQEQLSDMLGISRQMLTRYVRGTATPSGYNLTRLCEILDCDVRELTKFGYIED